MKAAYRTFGALAAGLACAGGLTGASFAAGGEPIYAGSIDGGGLTARTPSNGCTGKASFDVLRGNADGVTTVQLVRVRKDLCRAYLPAGVVLTWSANELGLAPGQPAMLINPRTDLVQ
jgi:hypothetical protein